MNRPQQPGRVRLFASRTDTTDRRRRRADALDELVDTPLELMTDRPQTSRAQVYWPYLVVFLLCSALGGLSIPAFGLFEGIGR